MTDHLTEREAAFFASVLEEFSKPPTRHERDCAVFLARDLAAWVAQADALQAQGDVVEGPSGEPRANPRVALVSELTRRVMAWRHSLGIHARGLRGEARDIGRRPKILKEAQDDGPLNDDLLARPKC